MSEALDTVTDVATSSLAKDLGKALVVSAAETAVAYTGAILVLAAAGAIANKVQSRKAKKNTLTVVPE